MLDMRALGSWIGRTETTGDTITPFPSNALAATLVREDPAYSIGSPLPPLWHWMHFLAISPLREAGPDGHSKRGGFLPPIPLPRRMWAGSRLEFQRPLRIGETARKTSRIARIDHKTGRSGDLVFVTVRHEYEGSAGLAIIDEQDIVFRDAQPSGAPSTPPPPRAREDHEWQRRIVPEPVMLFRYSALTFNSHRIHYDYPYVTGEEGYPGLVVHGPLIATLLLDLLRRELPGEAVKSFSFRAVSPLYSGRGFDVRGSRKASEIDLWAVNSEGGLAMDGRAVIA